MSEMLNSVQNIYQAQRYTACKWSNQDSKKHHQTQEPTLLTVLIRSILPMHLHIQYSGREKIENLKQDCLSLLSQLYFCYSSPTAILLPTGTQHWSIPAMSNC